MSSYEVGFIRTDRGLFQDKGNVVWDLRHPDLVGQVDPLAYAVAEIGSDDATILLAPGTTWTITANRTIPSNITLDCRMGVIATGAFTLTINGPVKGGRWQAFDTSGGGSVVLGAGVTELADVRWFGATGDGATNDLTALQACSSAAGANAAMYLSPGRYIVAETFYNAGECNIVFAPDAVVALSAATVNGAAFSFTAESPTAGVEIEVFNPHIDCNNVAGENACGVASSGGRVNVYNLRIKNCLASDARQGGKGFQIEGFGARFVNVYGFSAKNCSIGVNINAHNTDVEDTQTVGVSLYDVAFDDVDIPIALNDTYTTTGVNDWDAMDLYIDSLRLRNCGRVGWGATGAASAGVIAADRAYKVHIGSLHMVNDAGGFGSTAYGTVSALVRGTIRDFRIDDALVVADLTAIFDFNPVTYISAGGAQVASYGSAQVRHFGDLVNVVKAPAGGATVGACDLHVEIDSTATGFTGICETNAGTYDNAFLTVVDRAKRFSSSPRMSFKQHFQGGNGTLSDVVGVREFSMRKDGITNAATTDLFQIVTANHGRYLIEYTVMSFLSAASTIAFCVALRGYVAVVRDSGGNITLGAPVEQAQASANDGFTPPTLAVSLATATDNVKFQVTTTDGLAPDSYVIVHARVTGSLGETPRQPEIALL